MKAGTGVKDIDAYIAGFPKAVQAILQRMRRTIHRVAPDAEESISYGIPTFKRGRSRVYIAGFAKHVSFFPAPRGARPFKDELAAYKGGKGTAQFPLDRPIPFPLIRRMTEFLMRDAEPPARARRKATAAKRKAAPKKSVAPKKKASPGKKKSSARTKRSTRRGS